MSIVIIIGISALVIIAISNETHKKSNIREIVICNFYTIYSRLGYPKNGDKFQVKMTSGKTAVYEVYKEEYCMNPDDMWWYHARFHHWLKEGESYPIYC